MRRENFIIVNNTGTLSVLNPDTRLPIPQGSATDAGGTGFNIPASIWLSFSFVVGLPMWFAGFRGRLPSGVGVGLAIAVACKSVKFKYIWNPPLPGETKRIPQLGPHLLIPFKLANRLT